MEIITGHPLEMVALEKKKTKWVLGFKSLQGGYKKINLMYTTRRRKLFHYHQPHRTKWTLPILVNPRWENLMVSSNLPEGRLNMVLLNHFSSKQESNNLRKRKPIAKFLKLISLG